jgi:tetratricopeptide (TPR) repeat protein
MQYKGTQKNIREIASELGASHIVEGSVRRAAQSVRITAQLIDARDDRHIWAERYDRELSAEAIFSIQSEIAREIARELETTLSPEVEGHGVYRPTSDLTAYDYYLQGNERARGGTRADLERSVAFYQQAIAQDPDYALAYSALTIAYTAMVGATDAPAFWLDSAEVAARKALELDSVAPESHSALALVYWNTGRLPQAVETYRVALARRPNDPLSLWGLAFAVWHRGELDAALQLMKRVVALDPIAFSTYPLLGRCYMSLGEFVEAEHAFRRALQLKSDDTWAHEDLIVMYLVQGEVEKAAQQLQTLGALHPSSAEALSSAAAVAIWRGDYEAAKDSLERILVNYSDNQFLPLAELGFAYARLGDDAHARELWRRATDQAESEDRGATDLFWAAVELGRVAAASGQRDDASRWLETSYQRGWRGWPTVDIALDPLLAGLSGDVRFEDLRNRILDDVERMRLAVHAQEAQTR